MEQQVTEVIEQCAAASHEGRLHFGEVVQRLAAQGIESYHADFRQRVTRYSLPSGAPHAVDLPTPAVEIAQAFDAAALVEAIRGSQRGEVRYPEFLVRAMKAGCIGYVVWIAGRHVTYFGRRGELHVERFPT